MKQTLTILFFLAITLTFAQQNERSIVPAGMLNTAPLTEKDAAIFDQIEALELPPHYRAKSLPDSLDNSVYKWFRRPIFSQTSYPNCMQSTSIAYNFTYEINRLRDESGDDEDHQYTTHFAWNFFNGGQGWYGVNYLFTMDVLKYHGTPSITDYDGFYTGGGERWMSGYDKWVNAMDNRITGIKKIYVGNEEGLLTLKHWLNDHLDGSSSGGLASFISCSPWDLQSLPPESPNAGKKVVISWCPEAVHGMTIIGYNDSIRYDYNNDGQFTNHIDLNNDGEINLKDWEIGALRFCNSYGDNWADSGFCYMMYKTLADDFEEGGIWTNTVHVLEAKAEHDTRMTYKVRLEHDFRERIRVQAGISSNLSSNKPEHIQSFTIFNYQGGWHYMQGNDTTPEHKTIEFGLDVTPLLSYVEPGQAYKFFLIVDEKDQENLGHGQLKHFSLIDYQDGVEEIICEEQNVPLEENSRTLLSIIYEPSPQDLEILTENLPVYEAGQPMLVQLEAQGGQEPYSWQLDRNYTMNCSQDEFPLTGGELIIENSWPDSLAIQPLDFEFPFYGNIFDTVVVSSSGYIYFDENMYFWSYLVDLAYFLKNSRVVAPLLCQDMSIAPGMGLGVWYEGDETKASFRWKTAHMDDFGSTVVNFAANLYPDGTIEFFYGDMILEYPMRWTSGISDGDFFNFNIPDLPDPPGIKSGTRIELFATPQPGEISVSKDGVLEVQETQNSTLREIKVAVTDNTLLSRTKTFLFTDALEYFLSIDGDEKLKTNNGESNVLDLIIRNRGIASMQNLNFSLSSSNPMLEILDANYTLASIAPGESIEISDAFSFYCDELMPDNQQIMLSVAADGQEVSYLRDCYMQSVAPLMELSSFEVMNEIDLLEPGKTEDILLNLVNNGNRNSINTRLVLSSDHPGISINTEQPFSIGTIGPWDSKAVELSVSANFSIAFGSEVNFKIELIDEIGLPTEIAFSMRIGRTPVYIIDMDLSTGSGDGIRTVLDRMGIEYDYSAAFPLSVNNYQSVFLCLGKHFSNHELTWQQGLMLEEYLNLGGNLFMEGRMIWEQEPDIPLLNRFGLETVSAPGMYEIVDGVDSTFTEGLVYENESQQPFCYFYMEPIPPAVSILTGREYPNCAAVAYDAGSYRTIGTIFEFGSLISSDSCQIDTLMQRILEFFDIKQGVTGIEEMPEGKNGTSMQNYPNPFSYQTRIPIRLEEKSHLDAAVFSLQGKRIYDLLPSGNYESGSYQLIWDGNGANGRAVPDGIYIYRILIDGIPHTGKMILIR